MHISRVDYDTDAVAANVARLTALNFQVQVTELDISLAVDSDGQAKEEDLRRQADLYRRILHACLRNPGCTAVQTWGFTDKYSWIGRHSHGTRGAALPFDRTYNPKPAHKGILCELKAIPERTH